MESWEDKRERLFKRDSWRCRRCHKESPSNLSLHHIIPRDMYGSDEDDNLITLCVPCHDWVELNQVLEPYLRTRTGIINSIPTVQYRWVENIMNKIQPGYREPGDKIDIWERWVKDGRKGARELIEKYGSKEILARELKKHAIMPKDEEDNTKPIKL